MDFPRFRDPALRTLRPEEVHVGLSGARVFHLHDGTGRPVAVFKSVPPDRPDLMAELMAESENTERLSRAGAAVPNLLETGAPPERTGVPGLRWMLTSHLPGTPAHEPRALREHPDLVEVLAEAAHGLHRPHPGSVLRYERLEDEVERARERVASGVVQRSWQGTGRAGTDPVRALAEVERRVERAGRLPLVVTHGDFCLPNVLVTPEGGWGFVDLGRAGLADSHRDLAAMVGSLRSRLNPHFGEADAERFLDAYGRERVDPEMLALHFEVDAFFWPAAPD
ncbi:aminoglycoside phosphotransferase APH(3') [Nocardiopsis ganjiahuensis]|uniref:aminoglycoside phosphotransferase APH(3') n=1 Tax=Nocardiopsis ganjiahuensis TaxID=239984 RepID=UPI000345E6C3|nr:aminoglycoside phosphotransferase APH(3') [Nocardiopsis ganjiahuensis]